MYRGNVPLTEDMIRDPPFRGARRVEGCFGRDEDDFGGGNSNVHYGGGGGGGIGRMSAGPMNGMSGNGGGSSSSPAVGGGGALGLTNPNHLHQQAYPYGGVLLGDSGWAGGGAAAGAGSGGRMRLGGAGGGGGGGGLATMGASLEMPAGGGVMPLLPGLRPSSMGGVIVSQGFASGQAGGGIGLQDLPLGQHGSREM